MFPVPNTRSHPRTHKPSLSEVFRQMPPKETLSGTKVSIFKNYDSGIQVIIDVLLACHYTVEHSYFVKFTYVRLLFCCSSIVFAFYVHLILISLFYCLIVIVTSVTVALMCV